MLKAINWYQEKITEKFGRRGLSASQQELMRRELESIQIGQRKVESSSVWQVPVHLEFDGHGNFIVNLDDFNEVLFLDE